jgi:hypothetical protein
MFVNFSFRLFTPL